MIKIIIHIIYLTYALILLLASWKVFFITATWRVYQDSKYMLVYTAFFQFKKTYNLPLATS